MWFVSKDNTPEENLDRSQLKHFDRGTKGVTRKRSNGYSALLRRRVNVYEIAKVMEITTGRVSQIKKSAALLLRSYIKKIY